MNLPRAVAALALLLASSGASAALCDAPCAVTMDFADGGSITTPGGATFVFSSGGALVLGTGGSITLGTGGSLTPNVDPPDMSAGGTLVLGTGGSIQFGTGGSLDTGAEGSIAPADASSIAVAGAASVAIDSAQSVHLGAIVAGAAASITAGGAITADDTTSPIDLEATGSVTVTSDADVTYDSVTGAPVELTPNAGAGAGGGFCGTSCAGGGTSSLGNPNIPTESNTFSSTNTGALGWLTLLPLALPGLRRRR